MPPAPGLLEAEEEGEALATAAAWAASMLWLKSGDKSAQGQYLAAVEGKSSASTGSAYRSCWSKCGQCQANVIKAVKHNMFSVVQKSSLATQSLKGSIVGKVLP